MEVGKKPLQEHIPSVHEFNVSNAWQNESSEAHMSGSPAVAEPPVLPNPAVPPDVVALEKPTIAGQLRNVPAVLDGDQSDVVSTIVTAPHESAELQEPQLVLVKRRARWLLPFWMLGRVWDLACLSILLAVVAAIPIVQLAALGYLLQGAGNLANRKPWKSAFPGLRLAGKLGTFLALASLTWIPVYLLTDLAYTAQLLQPNSQTAIGWRIGAFLIAAAWVTHVGWAAMRGGRWWHFLWPAPFKLIARIWWPSTWSTAADNLYELFAQLHFTQLWWLGARASLGAILWTCVPVSQMIIGERAHEFKLAGLVGLIGAVLMIAVMMYLPLLQVRMAATNRFMEIFNVRAIRQDFLKAPWFCALAIFLVCGLSIPLYLLRIEATPSQLVWAPSLVFVLFMWPAKLVTGAALGYAKKRTELRHWTVRWSAWIVVLASVLAYLGALYIAQFVASQGAYVMYFQHAVLFPPPLTSN
jgi:Protein of unknown function (DUF4013)